MQSDTTLNPLQLNITLSQEDGHLEFVIVTGTLLPVGNGQAMPLPLSVYRLPFPTKSSVQEFHEQLGKALAEMEDDKPKSDIIVPNNMQQANQMAESLKKFVK